MLIIATAAAVVLALMRSKSDQALGIVAFIINAVCAAWAALAHRQAALDNGTANGKNACFLAARP